jgi:hypothetical protein
MGGDRREGGSAGRDSRRRVPRAVREQEMLEVAGRVFAERGFHGASMDEIAGTATDVEEVGDTGPLAVAFVGAGESLADWWLANPDESTEDMAARLMNVAWLGLDRLVRGRVRPRRIRPPRRAGPIPCVPVLALVGG